MKNGTKILIGVLSLVTAAAIGVTIWAVFFREKAPPDDYAPQQVEANAEQIEDEKDKDKLEQSEGGGAVSLTYSTDVVINLSTKEANIMFQNPTKSNQNMKLELVIDDKTIAETGRLEPGYKISKISNVDTQKLKDGNYDGKFVISYYNSESLEKAILNTEIPVKITVKN